MYLKNGTKKEDYGFNFGLLYDRENFAVGVSANNINRPDLGLKKKMKRPNGITVNYFRISRINIDLDFETTTVFLKSYVSKDYRDKEKEFNVKRNNIEIKTERLNTLVASNLESTVEERKILTEELNKESFIRQVEPKVSIEELKVILDGKYLTIEECYQKLKEKHFLGYESV